MRKLLSKNNYALLLLTLPFASITAQVKISNSSGVINPESVLQLESSTNDQGFLLTRIPLQQTNLPNPLSAHTAGIIVYNTATAGTAPNNVTPGLYYNNGTSWVKLTTKGPKIGDVKNSFQSADHNGWYLLNGRAVTTLAVNPRAKATALGFATNLPDATDRYLKNTSGSDAITALAGADTFTLTQARLPNVNFIGNTSATANHTHTYTDNPATTINVAAGTNNPLAANNQLASNVISAGSHNHTISFSLGGSSQPVNFEPGNIITNVFIYLGH
jgi:microcystin-dependent protein